MKLEQASDFIEECSVLQTLLEGIGDESFSDQTQFKSWTVNDILVHLHFWNTGADLSLNDPDAFLEMFEGLYGALKAGNLRAHENAQVPERGKDLLRLWSDTFRDMGRRWQDVDPKTRVKWAGPDMSARTSMSARQMETWAHGQALFDLLGQERPESDRIRNIVMLGINAFGWSHKVHGLPVPDAMPHVRLISPSGAVWEYGDGNGNITGTAVEFCQVVTQTRNVADTELEPEGEAATTWMQNAQCFAGPPEKPPAPGTRYRQ